MNDPLISVVIPVKNGVATLASCLEGIRAQTLGDRLEIIVTDSGSTDGTLELLARYPVQVHHIVPVEFNHGETRNLGVRMAHGEFVVMTVQDARPVDDRWLERMVKHFEDPKVAGVCGQQVVPHELDKNPLQWFRPYCRPVPIKIQFANPSEFQQLPPAEQVALCGWDDVTAMYRRSTLLGIPFRRVNFSEDAIWARDALSHGCALVYDYSARVYHYHHETFRFRFRRIFTIQYQLYRFFNHVRAPDWLLPRLIRQVYWSSKRIFCPERRVIWCAYNLRLIFAEWLASWCFWCIFKCGGKKLADKSHNWLCARPPQPVKAS
jgi:rhamnosyltransferase